MPKKKKTIEELSESKELGSLEKEIVRIIQETSHTNLLGLAADDIKLIAKELMPDLDAMIAKKVKAHFYEMGQFLVDKFKIEDD